MNTNKLCCYSNQPQLPSRWYSTWKCCSKGFNLLASS